MANTERLQNLLGEFGILAYMRRNGLENETKKSSKAMISDFYKQTACHPCLEKKEHNPVLTVKD